ncbi:aspartate--tRNA ligase [Candidatus Woesearchaeota archaeon]|nr:aspartate--tRNA ligase [Candidatus Woesearchaeota archaeon]
MLRTHTCGELRLTEKGTAVTLCGWMESLRTHGGISFMWLRDRYGITQVVFDEKHNKSLAEQMTSLRREDVLQISGIVRYRGDGLINKNLATGEIEVLADSLKILAKADILPMDINNEIPASEEMRLKYRYLDLRRPVMQHNLLMRHRFAQAVRDYMMSQHFVEIETPILMKSTPEGARDYVVPSRIHPGEFYALPQSPQLYKQILMVAGMDRYFQLARCLRDEDLRADRQPEHTQIDIEMSFVEQDDIHAMAEGMLKHAFKKAGNIEIHTPFPKIKHTDAMERYGCDKPDLRFGLELKTVSDIVKHSDFGVFKIVLEAGGIVKAINAEKCGEKFSRKEIDAYIKFATDSGAKGLAYVKITPAGFDSGIAKFLSKQIQELLMERLNAKSGDILFFCADKPKVCNEVLNKVRNKLGVELGLIDPQKYTFCWVVDFPLFEYNEEEQSWDPCHHMFCMPKEEHLEFLETDPGKVYCHQYDLVLNGWEMGSGSLRINRPEIQERVMKVVGFPKERAQARFGFLIDSFKYGAPPHGGIGIGLDRMVSMLLKLSDIREVIAFPKNKQAQCPMDGCPSPIDQKQMDELKIRFEKK